MPRYDDVTPALKWAIQRLGRTPELKAERVVSALSVEQLPEDQIPAALWPNVKAFRKFRTDVRIHIARRYLTRGGAARVNRSP